MLNQTAQLQWRFFHQYLLRLKLISHIYVVYGIDFHQSSPKVKFEGNYPLSESNNSRSELLIWDTITQAEVKIIHLSLSARKGINSTF